MNTIKDTDGNEYADKVRYRNSRPRLRYPNREYENRLGATRLEENMTLKEVAEIAGVTYTTISKLQSGMTSIMRSGRIKPWVQKICDHFKTTPAYMFPREICDIKRGELTDDQKNDILIGTYTKINAAGSETRYITNRIKSNMLKLLATLTVREERIIICRFYMGLTLQETADHPLLFSYKSKQKERIRQIEGRALRKLRHPSRSRFLK